MFTLGLVIVWCITARRCRPSLAVMWTAYGLFLVGAVGLLAATLVGGFGAGWYALYPLPFVNPVWPSWATGATIVSLMLLGVAWLLIQLDILRAMAARYGARRLLAWDYLAGREPSEPLPAAMLIASMCTIAGVLGTLSGAATLVMYFFKWQAPTHPVRPAPAQEHDVHVRAHDRERGHVLRHLRRLRALADVHQASVEGEPDRGRLVERDAALRAHRVLPSPLHGLRAGRSRLQVVGQFASYGSAIPATAVTVFGLGSQVYRSGVRWTFAPLAFFTGIMGWVIGGIAAVVDSTIAVNRIFHNTLWVPGHFHTYFLVGFVLIALGFVHDFVQSRAERMAGVGLAAMLVGGYGFVLMFYLGGMSSVPRRYASYAAIPFGSIAQTGTRLALYGAAFASLFLLGALAFYLSLVLGRRRADKAGAAADAAPQ